MIKHGYFNEMIEVYQQVLSALQEKHKTTEVDPTEHLGDFIYAAAKYCSTKDLSKGDVFKKVLKLVRMFEDIVTKSLEENGISQQLALEFVRLKVKKKRLTNKFLDDKELKKSRNNPETLALVERLCGGTKAKLSGWDAVFSKTTE